MNQPVKTYSIGFEGNDRFYNELPYAGIVAKSFSTDHHEIIVRPDIVGLLPDLMWHLEEPIADSAFVTTYLVAKLASESVTVILSGVGGDELFGGYRRYLGSAIARYYGRLPAALRKNVPHLLATLPQDRHSRLKNYFRYADAFVKSAESEPLARYLSYVTLFSEGMQQALLSDTASATVALGREVSSMRKYFEAASGLDGLNRLIYIDLKTSLADDLLALTDKMTMATSIECRAPFMDHELVELAARMPEHLKVHGLQLKYLLKKVVKPWLPKEIIHRKKRGFGAPIGSWLRKDLEPLVATLLSEPQVRKRGLFQWPVVKEMIVKHENQQQDYTDHLLALIGLELWCQIFLDRRSAEDVSEAMLCESNAR
jgi:asparagine synthase (glutamine-hydrolysing)